MDFTFQRFVADPHVRAQSWAMRREMLAAAPEPNAAHRAVARLERAGRALGVVTQNIDGLHQAAGSTTVRELHGTAREVACIGLAPVDGTPEGCGWRAPAEWAFEQVDAGIADPRCPGCGGLVKSATISFGQAMDLAVVAASEALIAEADALVVVGTSLQVYPAASMPAMAVQQGIALAIVNNERTPQDHLASVVVHGQAGDVLDAAVTEALRPA
jgi:NAD-dependent deacetylase